jgi:hypothetical protein
VPAAPKPPPFSLRLTPDERADLDARAKAAGLSVGGYFRAAVLGAPPPNRRRAADAPELARLMGAIGRIGSNINQLAHVANAGSWPDSRALDEAVADIRWMRNAVMKALGVTSPPDPAGGGQPNPAP